MHLEPPALVQSPLEEAFHLIELNLFDPGKHLPEVPQSDILGIHKRSLDPRKDAPKHQVKDQLKKRNK